MVKKVKLTFSCDRCDREITIDEKEKSRYGMFPEDWGDLKSKTLNGVLCQHCIQSLKEWIYQK